MMFGGFGLEVPKDVFEDHPGLPPQMVGMSYASGYGDGFEDNEYFKFPDKQFDYQPIYEEGFSRGTRDREIRDALMERPSAVKWREDQKKRERRERIYKALGSVFGLLNPTFLICVLAIVFFGWGLEADAFLLVGIAIALSVTRLGD